MLSDDYKKRFIYEYQQLGTIPLRMIALSHCCENSRSGWDSENITL